MDTRREDLERLGASAKQIEEMLGPDGDQPPAFRVFPTNWPAMQVFMAMDTQWDVIPPGILVRLIYEAMPAVMDMLGVRKRSRCDIFKRVRIIEKAVLAHQGDQQKNGA